MNRLFIIALIAVGLYGRTMPALQGEEPAFDYAKAAEFWSFQRPVRHPKPTVNSQDWIARHSDAFVLKKIEAAGLSPAAPADRRTLFRRLGFDLIGLPPEAADIDNRTLSTSEYVEKLLASPHFGERWARPWLDVVRYAEDQAHIVGKNTTLTYPNAWLYRDWVINALNRDVPYDDFLRFQLAADLVDRSDEENLAALGFMGLGPKYYRRKDLAVMADEWEDRVDTLSRGILGLTMACARCHDHFFDPIPTSDYYALAGVFASTDMFNSPMTDGCEMGKDGQTKKPDDAAHILRESTTLRDLHILERGNPEKKGEQVSRGFLTVLGGGKRLEFTKQNSGRLDLAEALISRDNPLTARVWVNRIWSELIGSPLVATKSNFGSLGEKPTHPELLDDLAVRFMEDGKWSLKWLIREIVLSSSYQQASDTTPRKIEFDADNTLLSRMNRKRLSAEMLRDALYTASGKLDKTIGGKSFSASDPEANRRAIYVKVSRLQLDPMLALYDFPDPNLHSPGRVETTTPLQKLFIMNHPLVVRQAELTAGLLKELNPLHSTSEQGTLGPLINATYHHLFARHPLEGELQLGIEYLKTGNFRDYVQALLASNEFSWID